MIHSPTARVRALDIARGLVMVLMAIDHVRVYAGVPAGGAAPALFFTRWVTHFCAPGFVFFAGTSAFLRHSSALGAALSNVEERGSRRSATAALSRYLVSRGLLIVLLELTVMRFAWTFNFDVMNYNLAGVLWMIGWSMVALGGLVWLPFPAIAAIGLVIMFAHNMVDPYARDIGRAIGESPIRWFWQFLYFGGSVSIGDTGPRIVILYSLLPWIGVMAAGYAFGRVLRPSTLLRAAPSAVEGRWPAERRDRACLAIGIAAITAFVVLRAFNIYGDPRPWTSAQPLSFLNTAKYPASLLFLLMTLGPLIALLPLFERALLDEARRGRQQRRTARGVILDALELFGRVPLFYYVLHIPLIHVAAIIVSLIRTGSVTPWLFGNHPMEPPEPPPDYRWSLGLLYLVTAICVIALYGACRWWVARKKMASGRLAAGSIGTA